MSDRISIPGTTFPAFPVDLSNCEREPIHIPGTIQGFGVLIVARAVDLRVIYVSGNVETVTGLPVASMLGRGLGECFGPELFDKIIRRNGNGDLLLGKHRTQALTVGTGAKYYFDIRHAPDLVYLEIEREEQNAAAEEITGQAQTLIDAMRSAESLEELLHNAAYHLRNLTMYDRVMVYRFDKDHHGHVIAEDCEATLGTYLDLHYPESDIPAQARKLYLLQRIRVLEDVAYTPVPMFADSSAWPESEPEPLDMTFCLLRSMSPIHIEYLRNMGVGATMTLSLIVDDQLWGLLVCHHREKKLPSPALRSSCDLLSQIISFLIRQRAELDVTRDSERRKKMVDEIAASLEAHSTVAEGLAAAEQALLTLVDAGGALVCFGGKRICVGQTPTLPQSLRIMAALQGLSSEKTYANDSLATLLPEFEPLRAVASGVLLMSILGSPDDGVLWFRPEVVRTVKWGGNPDKPVEVNPETGRISPRKSFETWKSLVYLHSTAWQPLELSAVVELKRAIGSYVMAQAESVLSRSSLADSLTQLPNRHYFQQKLREWMDRSDLLSAGVILIALDRFKRVNEAFGHTSGDDLLLQVARRLASFVTDQLAEAEIVLARLGGDEFAMLCTGMPAAEVEEVARRVKEQLTLPFHVLGRAFRATASLGIAHSSHGGEEELLGAADTAMHGAKRSGGNRVVSFDKLPRNTVTSSLEMEQDLYRAIEEGEFQLVYQPIVMLPETKLYGFEALIRWNHPEKGIVPPLNFIPIAEEIGLIVPIGRWVMREALKSLKGWADRFGEPLTIHVNVAAPQLITLDFVDYVVGLVAEFELKPKHVSIEVTESVLMRDLAVEALRELRNRGFGVSVDDFGTGYSSLAYLQTLPVDLVKIDRSFVRDVATQARSKDFLGALLHLTRTLGLRSVAEGVETATQGGVLLEAGCRLAQGYFFSKPVASGKIDELLALCQGHDGRLMKPGWLQWPDEA
jgi:diguanylate cyclase (GGDEF)-like protein